jgi:pheromone alpha factor receptor
MSAMATATAPANFDPFNQDFTLIDGNGNEIVANMGIVDQARLYGMRTAINHGTQVGASFMLLLVLLLLTRREKRRSWIFIMNAICLVINTIDSLLTCIYFTGNFFNIYSTLTGDTSRDTATDRGVSIAANTLTLILYICIMVSLSMQVWVVCVTAAKLQRLLIMGATTVIATIAIGYRFAVTVISNHTIMNGTTMKNHNGVLRINYIFQAIAIWAYCCVFTFKLGFALLQRHKLGMTQFGPMQVIFIMGAQCMIIPGKPLPNFRTFYNQRKLTNYPSHLHMP